MSWFGKRVRSFHRATVVALGLAGATACSLDVDPPEQSRIAGNVGLEVDVVNGAGKALTLRPVADGQRYYIDQVRFRVDAKDFPVPEIVEWLAAESEMARLDWTGLTTVVAEHEGAPGDVSEYRGQLNAAWMQEAQMFRIQAYDSGGGLVAGPILVDPAHYVIARNTALTWSDGAPSQGDYGTNTSTYPAVAVTTSGAFTGAANDIYDVQVATAGTLDGTAMVTVASVRGDDVADPVPVISSFPIALGTSGASITFTESGGLSTELAEGDRWTVRVTAGDEPLVGPATAGTRARFSAIAEIRMQFPHSRHIEPFTLPESTTELRVFWSERPDEPYIVPVSFAEVDETTPGYGLEVELVLSEPANRSYYVPGETVNVAANLYDGQGNLLHEEGKWPTYRQYIMRASNGIQYYRLGNEPSLGFFTDNRLNLSRIAVYGPKQDVVQNYTLEHTHDFFLEEVNLPDVGAVIFAGFGNPDAWDTEIPNNADFVIPEDAEPGTYIALAKTARTYRGQSVYREAHVDFQVGQPEPTEFDESVGNCEVCHTADSRLDRLRHGISIASPKFCEPCHTRPHADPVAVVIHRVHFFSSIYPVRKSGCSLCHLDADSNTRASQAVCGACHGAIHPDEELEFDPDPYVQCGQTCHRVLPEIHVVPDKLF